MKMIGKVLVSLLMTASILLAFFYAPEATRPNFGTLDATGQPVMEPWPAFRIFFFHVPAAWIAVLAFAVSMIFSIRVLRSGSPDQDDKAAGSARLGFLFCTVGLVSGMIWARHEWGAFWSWDPRQTTVLILLMIYAGYFTLRSSVAEPRRRARLAGVYSIVAFVTVPFLVFIVPRIMETLHPSPIIQGSGGGTMDPKMRSVFFLLLISYTGIYLWMLSLTVRTEQLRRILAQRRA